MLTTFLASRRSPHRRNKHWGDGFARINEHQNRARERLFCELAGRNHMGGYMGGRWNSPFHSGGYGSPRVPSFRQPGYRGYSGHFPRHSFSSMGQGYRMRSPMYRSPYMGYGGRHTYGHSRSPWNSGFRRSPHYWRHGMSPSYRGRHYQNNYYDDSGMFDDDDVDYDFDESDDEDSYYRMGYGGRRSFGGDYDDEDSMYGGHGYDEWDDDDDDFEDPHSMATRYGHHGYGGGWGGRY